MNSQLITEIWRWHRTVRYC